MLPRKFSIIAPILCCAVAAIAMVAAGVLLYDSRDQISGDDVDDIGEFSTYQSAEPVEPREEPTDSVDWDAVADAEDWEILQPRHADETSDQNERLQQENEETDDAPAIDSEPAGSRGHQGPTGRIVVVTNFTRADVVINGDPYPTYSDDGQNRGMELPANEVHEVLVEFDGNEQLYEITLRAGERRMLMIELTGLGEGQAAPRERERETRDRRRTSRQEDDDEDIGDDEGRITVYSRPRGEIYVGDESTGEDTPGTVDVEPGRHEVQVEYRGGEMSETKTVRVREGSRVKLFFRESD